VRNYILKKERDEETGNQVRGNRETNKDGRTERHCREK
jgi:hypothetical protein